MSVLRPRFSTPTPNRKWADAYKRLQRFKYPAVIANPSMLLASGRTGIRQWRQS